MYFTADIGHVEPEGLGAIEALTFQWQQAKGQEGEFWDQLHCEAYKELERRFAKGARYHGDCEHLIYCVMQTDELKPGAQRVILKRIDHLRKWWAALYRAETAFFLARLLEATEKAFEMQLEEVKEEVTL